jgi:hypothetical protein
MQERNADSIADRNRIQPVDHGITVEQVPPPVADQFRASCLCGWQSNTAPSRPRAVIAGRRHVADVFRCPGWCVNERCDGEHHSKFLVFEASSESEVDGRRPAVTVWAGESQLHGDPLSIRLNVAFDVEGPRYMDAEVHLTTLEARDLVENLQLLLAVVGGAR